MNTKEKLKAFYNKEAKKYYQTRNKYRSDWETILQEIKNYWKKNISILEFWCGWWRCIKYLNDNLKEVKIKYTGVDLSDNLLNYAKKDNPNGNFICTDISSFSKDIKQESYDFIIWIASFQHIPSNKEKLFLMKRFYQWLKYWWKIIMTNRSFSKRFIKKHKKTLLKSLLKSLYTLCWHNLRDLEIPRINWKERDYRFYHIFSLKELESLSKESWFIIGTLTYLDKTWHKTNSRKNSNNTLLIAKKEIFL